MNIAEFQTLGHWVLASAFLLSAVLGAFLHRTHFCTMGAISDVVHSGSWQRANQWLLAIAFSCLGVGLISSFQLIEIERASVISNRLNWLSDALGGLMFGAGMVLASGCGAKMLVRVGTGNLKSLLVLLVMGIASFATLKGLTAVLRVKSVDQIFWEMPFAMTLPNALHHVLNLELSYQWVGLIFALCLMSFVLRNDQGRQPSTWLIGFAMGGLVTLAWLLSGYLGHVVEHPETLEDVLIKTNTNRMEAFTFVAPVAYTLDWIIHYSDVNKVLTIGIMSVFGVIFGAHASARSLGQIKWESFADASDFKAHLVGAVLMGIGGVTAMGCTFGQGLSGLSVLSLNALIAVPFMVVGARLAFAYQYWALERDV